MNAIKTTRSNQHYSRFDADSTQTVEKGIALQEAAGTAFAAHYLQSQKICTAVILRVLLRPHKRRAIKTNLQAQ